MLKAASRMKNIYKESCLKMIKIRLKTKEIRALTITLLINKLRIFSKIKSKLIESCNFLEKVFTFKRKKQIKFCFRVFI